jgi:tRNA(Ile)-lysidine synthase
VPVAKVSDALTGILNGLTGFSRVAVAVSGGSDSMALLRLTDELRRMPRGPSQIFALTVDHGLRPTSADEAMQVAVWCKAIGVDHIVLQWAGEKPATGIQAKARVARYDAMSAWCRENSIPVLMTAHTVEDQAETVVMRQHRTTTDRSLAAIWPENEWHGVKLFRPLLGERRLDLRNYLSGLGQGWLEDPSNTNSKFERVRVRAALNPLDVSNLAALASSSQQKVREADQELKHWLREFSVVDDYAVVRFPRQIFLNIAQALQIDVLSWALCVAGDQQKPERATVESLCVWIDNEGQSRRSANGAIVSARRHLIEVMREPARISSKFLPVGPEGSVVFDGRFLVTAPEGALVGAMGLPPQFKRPKNVPAFAFSALPLVKLADGEVISPVKSARVDVLATLCERFLL